MAEEKKFLDETMEQPKNRKLVAKNVVLAFVVFVILLLCVLAWFTSRSEATASGLSVKTSGENGLEVSIRGTGSTDQWTDFDVSQTYNAGFSNKPMPLISGDGINFFKPDYAVSKTISSDFDIDSLDNVSWQELDSNDIKDNFVEYQVRFRNSKIANVYLDSESQITSPKDTEGNYYTLHKNKWGFSKDYISGATRVAFLNDIYASGATAELKRLWVPNPEYELTKSPATEEEVDVYKKVTQGGSVKETEKTVEESINLSGGEPSDEYFLWMPLTSDDKVTEASNNRDIWGGQIVEMTSPKNILKVTKNNNTIYYYQFTIPAGVNGDIPFIITKEKSVPNTKLNWVTGKADNENDKTAENQFMMTFNGSDKKDFIINSGTFSMQTSSQYGEKYDSNLNIKYKGQTYCYFEKINVQPSDEARTIQLSFTINNNEKSGIPAVDDGGTRTVTVKEYSVDNSSVTAFIEKDKKVVITASKDSVNWALKGTTPSDGVSVTDPPPSTYEYYLKVSDNADGLYKLVNSTGQYLAITSDDSGDHITTSDTPTGFYIVKDGNNLLLYNAQKNLYLNYNGSNFVLSSDYNRDYTYSIYEMGKETQMVPNDGWTFDPNGKPENSYKFRSSITGTGNLSPFDISTTPNGYFTTFDEIPSEYSDSPTTKNFIVNVGGTLQQDGYYYSDIITVRIWGEGYDREARTPLQAGIIQALLKFRAVELN